jgi:hypothetical protein
MMPTMTTVTAISPRISRRRGDPTRNRDRARGAGAVTRRRVAGWVRSIGVRWPEDRRRDGAVVRARVAVGVVVAARVERVDPARRELLVEPWRRSPPVPCERDVAGFTAGAR